MINVSCETSLKSSGYGIIPMISYLVSDSDEMRCIARQRNFKKYSFSLYITTKIELAGDRVEVFVWYSHPPLRPDFDATPTHSSK